MVAFLLNRGRCSYGRRFLSSVIQHNEAQKGKASNTVIGEAPPIPKKKPFSRSAHEVTWDDPYHWLSQGHNSSVIRHLEQENRYSKVVMSDTTALQSELKKEMSSRVVGDSTAPPERWGPWLYYARIPEGKDYTVYLRKPHTPSWVQKLKYKVSNFMQVEDPDEEKLLDMNELVKGRRYLQLGVCKISKNHSMLAYTVDISGKEKFTLFIKNIDTGTLLPRPIIKGVVNIEWARDGRSFLYTTADDMHRAYRVFKHTLGSSGKDVLLYEETDPQNYVDISRTKDWQFFTININSKTSSEVYILDSGHPGAMMQLVAKRRSGVEYYVEHHCGSLFILTNTKVNSADGCVSDYRLFHCPVSAQGLNNWKEIIFKDNGAIIYDIDIFEKHLVLYCRSDGLPQINVLDLPLDSDRVGEYHHLPVPKGTCSIVPGLNQDYYSSTLRISVSSPIMPEAVLDYDMPSKTYVILQQEKIHASVHIARNVHQSNSCFQDETNSVTSCKEAYPYYLDVPVSDLSQFYACEHIKVPSIDMTEVPLTVVYSPTLKEQGQNPAVLIGYGAYGEILSLNWCSDYLSLLDRGWVLAFAHVRGGGELGKKWHHSGRVLQKLNSMHDFLACAHYLLDNGYVHKERLCAKGISAGGLLVASAINMQPSLFKSVILKVPFVDICNTMLDENLALTIPDYEEWGNPNDKEIFEYIRSYSPYDNVKQNTAYPAMLVLSSFLDIRVGYWEAAKWVARVRDYTGSPPDRPALLKTNMDSGHFSESGRYSHIADTAFEYAFLLKTAGEEIQ